MSGGKYPINIWINEERFARLNEAGLAHIAKEVMAGLKVIHVYADDAQKIKLLEDYPGAKYDSATTGSIELLPRKVKDEIFALVVRNKNTDVLGEFLKDR